MAVTHEGRETSVEQRIRLANLEKRLEMVTAMEHESRMLLQVTHAQLLHAQAGRQQAEAQVAELKVALDRLRGEIERRDARIRELKARLDRVGISVPGRVWRAAHRFIP